MQADEGRLDPLLADVADDVDAERVVAEAIAARARLDARQVDAARRELLKEGQQRTRLVDWQGHLDGRLIRAGRRGHHAGAGHQDEAGDRARIVGDVGEQGLKAVGVDGDRVAQGSIEGGVAVGEQLGGGSRRRRGHVNRAREGLFDPSAALRPRVRVSADAADILGARARQDGQLEDDMHVHLGNNDEGIAVREGIQRRIDAALDGVFDRDDGAVGLAATHGRERLRGARHRHEDRAGGSDLVDGLFGKRAEGAEEGDTKLVTEGRGAGNVRRHGVKGNESIARGAASFQRRGRIVANRAGFEGRVSCRSRGRRSRRPRVRRPA